MSLRRALTAFFGLSFLFYFFWNSDPIGDRKLSLDPVKPQITRAPAARIYEPPPLLPTKAQSRAKAPDIGGWLRQESELVGQIDPDPHQTTLRLKRKAAHLSAPDIRILKTAALDKTRPGDERFLAVYILGFSASGTALEALKEIGQTRIADTANDREYSDEFILRAQAVESLVKRLPPQASVDYLKKLLGSTADPAIAKHAQYWLSRLS